MFRRVNKNIFLEKKLFLYILEQTLSLSLSVR